MKSCPRCGEPQGLIHCPKCHTPSTKRNRETMLSNTYQTHYYHVWADQHSVFDIDTILQEFAADCFISSGLEVVLEDSTVAGALIFSTYHPQQSRRYDSRLFLHGAV